MIYIHYIRQKEPRGFGKAVYCVKTFVWDEYFAITLIDDVVYSEEKPCLKQLIDCYNEYKTIVLAFKLVQKIMFLSIE